MRAFLDLISDLGSVILAFGLVLYFTHFPGHEPDTKEGFGGGIAIVLMLAVLYVICELLPVFRDETPPPLYLAWETMISYAPINAFYVIGTLWVTGQIFVSFFQFIVAGIFLAVTLFDVLGILAIMAQRLFLTSDMKTTQ